MAVFKRPSFWYESWMIGTSEIPATARRRSVAKELLQAIKDRDYDSQSLEEVILLIDHEYLCLKLKDSNESADTFASAIGIPLVGEFAGRLLSCLIEFVVPSSYSERELQCRAIVSVLALLELHGVKGQQTDSKVNWQGEIKRRFQDLVWQPGDTTAFSIDMFNKVQCAYLLSFGAAYAQKFIKGEPKTTAVLDLATDVVQLGVVIGTTALVCLSLSLSL
jgi:hypothetical protein